jgi:predicted acylesterase/phospholipase RssA
MVTQGRNSERLAPRERLNRRAEPVAFASLISSDTARRRTVGLVLEGGGAKGAFQFGCLLAFRELGVEFDAIAGTSVGALNAALWSTNQIDWGKSFWETISFEKVYPLRKPVFLFFPFALLYALLRWLVDRISGLPQVFFIVGTVLTWLSFFPAFGVGFLLLVKGVLLLTGHDPSLSLKDFSLLRIPFWISLPFLFLWIVELFGISAFTSRPLQTALTHQLSDKEFRVPIFSTVSRLREVYDPDNLTYMTTGIPPSNAFLLPQPVSRYVPEYVRVDIQEHGEACRHLLASAALPYGVVPAIDGAVDGGMADNMPIFPLVSLLACDVVMIVRANPGVPRRTTLLRAWQDTDRLIRVLRYNAGTAHLANTGSPSLGSVGKRELRANRSPSEPSRLPAHHVQVFVIAPDLPPLPGWKDLVRRTMNFKPQFTLPLMDAGYALAKNCLIRGMLDELTQ